MSESPRTNTDETDESTPSTLLNAVIGSAVTIVLSFIPFSPILGGGVAGYLEGGDTETGAKVGAISGVIASIPIAAIVTLLGAFLLIAPPGSAIRFGGLLLLIIVVVLIYTAGLSALGGILGVYVKNEV